MKKEVVSKKEFINRLLEELVRYLEFAGHELEAGELESFLQAEESYL